MTPKATRDPRRATYHSEGAKWTSYTPPGTTSQMPVWDDTRPQVRPRVDWEPMLVGFVLGLVTGIVAGLLSVWLVRAW